MKWHLSWVYSEFLKEFSRLSIILRFHPSPPIKLYDSPNHTSHYHIFSFNLTVIWYDMIWYDTIWYMIWYDMIWYDMIYDMIWYETIWYDMILYDIWYDMIWYDTIWYVIWYDIWYDMIYDTIRYDMIWYDTIWYMMWYDTIRYDMIWYDIFVNYNWVVTRGQQNSTHLHTNNTQNDTKQTIHRTTQQLESAGRALSWLVIPWHLPYNRGKTSRPTLRWLLIRNLILHSTLVSANNTYRCHCYCSAQPVQCKDSVTWYQLL
jgi:hypothetical protein